MKKKRFIFCLYRFTRTLNVNNDLTKWYCWLVGIITEVSLICVMISCINGKKVVSKLITETVPFFYLFVKMYLIALFEAPA